MAKPFWTLASLVWLAIYVATMVSVVLGLTNARQQALKNFASADAAAEWNAFRADMQEIADDPNSPVDRRVPKSAEPPTLQLLRDHFAACLVLALLLTSALFITLMVMIRGVLSGARFTPRADTPTTGRS